MATQPHTHESVLAKFYAAEKIYMSDPSESNFDQMVASFSADLKIIQTPGLPYGGVWEGVAGFRGWSEQMSTLFDVVDVQNPTVFTNEQSDRVLILGRLILRVRKSQKILDNPMIQNMLIDREAGLIKEIQPFYWDVQGLVEAVELR